MFLFSSQEICSGNFVVGQENLERTLEVMEKLENLKINGCHSCQKIYFTCSRVTCVLLREIVQVCLLLIGGYF